MKKVKLQPPPGSCSRHHGESSDCIYRQSIAGQVYFDADGNGRRYWVIQLLSRLLSTQGLDLADQP